MEEQTKKARELGLKARYWDTRTWPVAWEERLWGSLMERGVGILNVDDVVRAAKGNWDWCVVLGVRLC